MPLQAESASNKADAGYDNDRYWTQRLEREFTLAGVGHTGVGLAFNRWAYGVRRRVLRRALRDCGVNIDGARILELGFGTGFYLDLWRDLHAAEVVGFDITEIAVQAARARFSNPGSATARWRFARADIGAPLEMGDAEHACDLATAFDVLFHLVEDQNWNGALDNIARAVKPGGCAVIFDKYQSVENAIGHVRRRTLDTYRDALIARGFEIVTVRPIFFLMNSPTDLSGLSKFVFKTAWSLTRLPYKIGKHIGLGEFFGSISGACLYWPELLLGRLFSNGPSTKILVARKKRDA